MKSGPGSKVKEEDAGGAFKKGRAGPKAPQVRHDRAMEQPMKQSDGVQVHNAVRKGQPKVLRYLR
jgi:hypothetical protein